MTSFAEIMDAAAAARQDAPAPAPAVSAPAATSDKPNFEQMMDEAAQQPEATPSPAPPQTSFAAPPVKAADKIDPGTASRMNMDPRAISYYGLAGTRPVQTDKDGNLNYQLAPPDIQNEAEGVIGGSRPDLTRQDLYFMGLDPRDGKMKAFVRNEENAEGTDGGWNPVGAARLLTTGLVTGPTAGGSVSSAAALPRGAQTLQDIEKVSPEIEPNIAMVGGPVARTIDTATGKIPIARTIRDNARASSGQSIGRAVDDLASQHAVWGDTGQLSGDDIHSLVTGNKLDAPASMTPPPDAMTPGTAILDNIKPKVVFANQTQTGNVAGVVDDAQGTFNSIQKARSNSSMTKATTNFNKTFNGMTGPQKEETVQNILNSIGGKDDLDFANKFQTTLNNLPPPIKRSLLSTQIGQQTQQDVTTLLNKKTDLDAATDLHGQQTFGDVLKNANPAQKTVIQGTVLSRLGKTSDVNQTPTFSPSKFVEDWQGISNKMKTAVFDPTTRTNIDNMVNLAQKISKPTATTGHASTSDALVGAIIEHAIGFTGLVGSGGTAVGAAKLFGTPAFVRGLYTLHRTSNVAEATTKANALRQMIDSVGIPAQQTTP